MTIRPLNDRIVVRRIEAETRSSGGIVIPDAATEKPSQGEVIAAGPGAVLESGATRALDVQVGDRVLFGSYAGAEVTLNGEKLLVMRESDVLAIVDLDIEQEKAA